MIHYTTAPSETAWLEVLDVNGRVVQSHSLAVGAAEQTLRLDLSNLAKGVYYCQLQTGQNIKTVKLLKRE